MTTRGALYLAESRIWLAAQREERTPAFSALVDTVLSHWNAEKTMKFWNWYCGLPGGKTA